MQMLMCFYHLVPVTHYSVNSAWFKTRDKNIFRLWVCKWMYGRWVNLAVL